MRACARRSCAVSGLRGPGIAHCFVLNVSDGSLGQYSGISASVRSRVRDARGAGGSDVCRSPVVISPSTPSTGPRSPSPSPGCGTVPVVVSRRRARSSGLPATRRPPRDAGAPASGCSPSRPPRRRAGKHRACVRTRSARGVKRSPEDQAGRRHAFSPGSHSAPHGDRGAATARIGVLHRLVHAARHLLASRMGTSAGRQVPGRTARDAVRA